MGRKQQVWLLALAILVLLWLTAGGGAEVVSDTVSDVVAPIINGPRVGPATTAGADGIIPDDPVALAGAALGPGTANLNTYALARCLMSEHGNDPDDYLIAVGWALVNYAAEQGRSIFQVLTDGKGTAGDNHFGRQSASAGTKYAATDQDPRQRHVAIAQRVIAGDPPDPTGGATHFFSPKAQDALNQRDPVKWKPAVDILASWTAQNGALYPEGATLVIVPGVDGYRLSLFRRGAT